MAINIDHTADTISSDSGGSVAIAPDSVTEGTIIAYKDNASSFRLRGPSSLNDPSAGANIQSFAGMFYNPAFANTSSSGLETRAIFGANVEMDLEIQAPRQLRITAVDNGHLDGQLRIASRSDVVIHTRTDAETDSVNHIIFDRDDQGSTGASNTSTATIETDSGDMLLWPGRKDSDAAAKVVVKKDMDMDTHTISGVVDPTAAQDAATKNYVDNATYLGAFTVGTLPAAASNTNKMALATDASGGRTMVISDGANWKVYAVEGINVTV